MKRAVLFLSIGALVIFLYPAHLSGQTPDQLVDNFMSYYQSGDPERALLSFFSYNQRMENNDAYLAALTSRLENIINQDGICTGYEILTSENILFSFDTSSDANFESRSLWSVYILVKHETQPHIFKLVFYKPWDIWVGYSLDTNIKVKLANP